jgi:hypothetical protein
LAAGSVVVVLEEIIGMGSMKKKQERKWKKKIVRIG